MCAWVSVSEHQGETVVPAEEPGRLLANGALPGRARPARLGVGLGLVQRHAVLPRNAPALLVLVLLPARPPGVALPVRAAQLSPRDAAANCPRAVHAPGVRQSHVEVSRVAGAHRLARPRQRDAVQ